MHKCLIDFETYYEPKGEYSLDKMPTMQYVRDDRFDCLGAALAVPGLISPGWYTGQQLTDALASIPWGDTEFIAHKAAFDAAVLTQQFGHTPAYYTCTMLRMRWAIAQGVLPPSSSTRLAEWIDKGDTAQATQAGGQALERYAMQDLKGLIVAYQQSQQWRIPKRELDLIDLHVRMAVEPVLHLNTQLLTDVANRTPPEAAVKLRKQKTFVAALQACGVEPETKESARTGKPIYAFAKDDAFMQTLAHHPDTRVRKLHELRTTGGSNINRTRAQRFLNVGQPLPVPLLYYAAHTARAGGQDRMNLQNLPRGGELRQALQAPPGHKLVIVDSSQIEVRVLAWLAHEPQLLAAFAEGRDPYIEFAAEVLYDKPHDDVTKEERRIAKSPVLACGFGLGRFGLIGYAHGMGIDLSEQQADTAVQKYRAAYPAIRRYGERLMEQVAQTGELVLPSGRKQVYPDRWWEGRELHFLRPNIFSKAQKYKRDNAKLFWGAVNENVTQAAARDLVMWQTLLLAKKHRVITSTHDEAVLCVPKAQAEQAKQDALEAFASNPPWMQDLPVAGEAVISDDYGVKP